MRPEFNKETRLAWKIKDVHHLHTNLAQAGLGSVGLHFGQPRILFTINDLAGASQKEIADRLQVTPASMAMSLKRLEKGGFLARTADSKDQRINKIVLTEKGQLAIAFCRRHMNAIDRQMLDGFSAQEAGQLSDYLERIYDNLTRFDLTTIEETAESPRPETC